MNHVYEGEALDVLSTFEEASIDTVYVDPPFGTGTKRILAHRKGTRIISKMGYGDTYQDYIGFLRPHLEGIKRVLKETGTMYLHLDTRWVHYAKVACDDVFGRECFLNEIIWAYDFGGRGKRKWPPKHDNILVYVIDPEKHVFNWDAIPRMPYKAPEMQRVGRTSEEAEARVALGKVPTDVWEMSIVGTNSKERNGYPTQKPVKFVERCIIASTPEGGTVLDCFAGSGTTGEAAFKNGRSFTLVDRNKDAIDVMKKRFKDVPDVTWHV